MRMRCPSDMPKQPKYARIGEQVRLVTVKRFIRCGYPLDRDVVKNKFAEEIYNFGTKAAKAILGITDEKFVEHITLGRHGDSRLEDAIVSYILDREHFGGKDRTIYEEEHDEHLPPWTPITSGAVGTIVSKKIVFTGKYHPPSGGYTYDGEFDWEPGYIDNPKAHCVYTLDFNGEEFVTLADHCERISVQNLDNHATVSAGGNHATKKEGKKRSKGAETKGRELQAHSRA